MTTRNHLAPRNPLVLNFANAGSRRRRHASRSHRAALVRRAAGALELLECRRLLTTYYVNDTWVELVNVGGTPGVVEPGDIVGTAPGDSPAVSGIVFDIQAHATIQNAVDKPFVTGLDTIQVVSGTYPQTVNITDTPGAHAAPLDGLTILGPQSGVDARTRSGQPEAVITTGSANETGPVFYIDATADNVTVDGFTFDGNGPASGGVTLLDGTTDSNAARGIVVDGDDAVVRNNIVTRFYRRGVQFGFNDAPSGGSVTQNDFNLIGADDTQGGANSGFAVLAFASPSVTDNDVTNVHNGVYHIQVYPPSASAITVSGNDIAAREAGITLNETSSSIPAITVTNNDVTTTAAGGVGAVLWSVGGGLNFSNNTFTTAAADATGIHAWVGTANVPMNVTVSGGTISGYARGVHVTNEADVNGTPTPANDAATVNVDGVAITTAAGGTGVLVEDTAAGTQPVNAGLTDVTINGSSSGAGVVLDGTLARLIGDTLGNTTFAGFTGTAQFVVLNNGAYANDEIDGTGASYNGVSGGPGVTTAQGFAIEDRITHRIDRPGVGLVRVKPAHVFVTPTSFAAPATDPSIQRGVDAAGDGDTVNLAAGSYAESVTIPISAIIDGEGEGPTPLVTWTSNSSNPLASITTTDATDDVTFLDIAFDGTNGANTAGSGINAVAPAANFDALTVDRSTFTDFSFHGINVDGDATNGIAPRNVVVSNSTFTGNGTSGQGGSGDISLFEYNGNASFNNLTHVGTATATTGGGRFGIQLRGVGAASGAGVLPMGTVSFNDVDISGDYGTQFVGLQRYSDVNNLTFTDVELGGATSNITRTFGALLRIDAVGTGTVTSPATIDLGNTYFRGLSGTSPVPIFLEFAPDNTFAFLVADAKDTRWNLSSGTGVVASAMTLPQAFEATDRTLDYADPDAGPNAFKGWAELQDGRAFNTPISSNINHTVDVVDAGGTIFVKEGTYTQLVNVDRGVTLKGAQAGVDPRPGRAGPETVMNNPGGSFSVVANNVVIDGFTVRDANTAPLGTGILLSSNFSGYQVINNIITNNTFGLYLNSQGTTQTVVRHNLFNANNQPGASSGDAIYADQGSKNILVEENRFTGHASAAMVFTSVLPTVNQDITVNNNQMVNDNSIVFFNTTNVDITNNTSTNSQGSVIFIGGGNNGVTITGNTASAAPTRVGVSLPNPATFGMTANSNVTIANNSLTGLLDAIRVSTGSTASNDPVQITGNTLNANTNGVNVNGGHASISGDNDIAINAGAGVLVQGGGTALIDGNDSTGIHDNFVGIDVNGGTATISNNDIVDNTTGIHVRGNGTATLTSNQFSGNALGLNVDSGSATITNTQRIDGVEIDNAGTVTLTEGNNVVLITTSLTTFGSGRLDLRDNAAIIDYSGASPIASIFTRLQSGYAGGAWNGPGIMSNTAANDAQMRTGVGYAEATDLFGSFPATFEGQQIDSTAVLLKYTLYGDADLNGNVNLGDFNRLAASFGQSPRRWSQGDFTFDQNVNLADFNRLAANFGMSVAPGAGVTGPSGDEKLPSLEDLAKPAAAATRNPAEQRKSGLRIG